MTNKGVSQITKYRNFLYLALSGELFVLLGIISNLTQIFESQWIKKLFKWNIINWVSYLFNVILFGALVFTYINAKRQLLIKNNEYNNYNEKEMRLWKRFIRTLRSFLLKNIPFPSVRDSLEPMLDELAMRLPNNGVGYKIAIAKPEISGGFKILANRGMDPASVFIIEQKADWIHRKTLFADGLNLPDDKEFCLFRSGSSNYENIQSRVGVGTSIAHFVISIKCHNYMEEKYPKNVLGILSIGVPKENDMSIDEEAIFYKKLYPVVKGIEGILLHHYC